MGTDSSILIFYDGWCSVCQRTAARFESIDRGRKIIKCIDFRTDPDAPAVAGVSLSALAASMHAKFPSGEVLQGPEALREIMNALGKGWQASWTRWPLIKPIADSTYRIFSRNRLRLFGQHQCESDVCVVQNHATVKNHNPRAK